MVEVDGMVFMLSTDSVMYIPVQFKTDFISLTKNMFQVLPRTDGRRYLSLYNGKDYKLYVCDTALLGSEYSPWYLEDDLHVIDFTNLTEFCTL